MSYKEDLAELANTYCMEMVGGHFCHNRIPVGETKCESCKERKEKDGGNKTQVS